MLFIFRDKALFKNPIIDANSARENKKSIYLDIYSLLYCFVVIGVGYICLNSFPVDYFGGSLIEQKSFIERNQIQNVIIYCL